MSRLLIVLIAVLVAGVLLWRGSSWRQRGSRAPEPRLPSEAIDDHVRVPLEPPQAIAVDSSDVGDLTSGRRSIQVVETSKVPSVAPEPRAEIVSVFVLTGRVVDDRGRGVADFRIEGKRADPSARGSGDEDLLESFRDTDGSFAVNGLVQGTWDLRATGREHAPSEFLRVGVPASGPIEIVLPREAGVSGRVVDPRGAPVVGASVQTSQKEGLPVFFSNKYSTDEQGLIEIRGLSPGSVGLLASGSGFAPSEVLSLDLAAGETVTGIVLRLRTGGTILGELVGADGRPQAGGAVSLHAQGYYISSETDVDGRFQVACVPPGEVIVWAETLEGVNLNERVTVSQGEMVHVHFAAPDGLVRLHGRVQAGGEPFAGGEVSASLVEGGTITGNYSHAEIDEDGAYQLTLTGAWSPRAGDPPLLALPLLECDGRRACRGRVRVRRDDPARTDLGARDGLGGSWRVP